MALKRVGTPVVLTGVLLCTGLVGCTEENPSPAPLPTQSDQSTESTQSSSPSDTATPSPSETPPVLPAAARGTSENAAKAFVRYYIGVVNHALRTGNIRPLQRASASACDSCAAVAENIEGVYAEGGYLRGNGWRINALKAVAEQPARRPIMQTGVFVNPQRKVAREGAEEERFDGGQNLMTFFLDRRGSEWVVQKWDQVQ